MKAVLKDHTREKIVQTDMMDLNKEIQYKPLAFEDPDYKFVQLIDEGI